MGKKVIFHLADLMSEHQYGAGFKLLYDKISNVLNELGIENEYFTLPRNPELHRNPDFNHILHRSHNNRDTVMHTDVSYLLDYYFFDPTGTQGWSSIRKAQFDPQAIDLEKADAYLSDVRQKYVETFRTKNGENSSRNVSEIPENCLAIFLQCPTKEHTKCAYVDDETMIKATIANRNGRPIIIKRHPVCRSPVTKNLVQNAIDSAPDIRQVFENTHALMPKIDTIVTMNSGAGFEGLLHEKHVITLGKCDFHHATANHSNPDEAFQMPRHSSEFIRKFVYWYLTTQVIHIDAENFDERVKEQLQKRGWI